MFRLPGSCSVTPASRIISADFPPQDWAAKLLSPASRRIVNHREEELMEVRQLVREFHYNGVTLPEINSTMTGSPTELELSIANLTLS
jgi:hypothetical protein